MMFRNGFSLTFLLISVCILLVITPHNVNGECDCDNPKPDSEQGKLSGFIHKVGCSIKSGAKAIGHSVQDGYRYVKNKISPTPKPDAIDTTQTSVDSAVGTGRDQEFIYDIDVRNGFEQKKQPSDIKLL